MPTNFWGSGVLYGPGAAVGSLIDQIHQTKDGIGFDIKIGTKKIGIRKYCIQYQNNLLSREKSCLVKKFIL